MPLYFGAGLLALWRACTTPCPAAGMEGPTAVHKRMLHDEDAESYGSWLRDAPDGGVALHSQLPSVCG
jgi:hypothetical protein